MHLLPRIHAHGLHAGLLPSTCTQFTSDFCLYPQRELAPPWPKPVIPHDGNANAAARLTANTVTRQAGSRKTTPLRRTRRQDDTVVACPRWIGYSPRDTPHIKHGGSTIMLSAGKATPENAAAIGIGKSVSVGFRKEKNHHTHCACTAHPRPGCGNVPPWATCGNDKFTRSLPPS